MPIFLINATSEMGLRIHPLGHSCLDYAFVAFHICIKLRVIHYQIQTGLGAPRYIHAFEIIFAFKLADAVIFLRSVYMPMEFIAYRLRKIKTS